MRRPAAGRVPVAALALAALVVPVPGRAGPPPPALRAPAPAPVVAAESPIETSSVALALTGLVRLYQRRVSPTSAGRCGFVPSCSAYGMQALRERGPLLAAVLIGDRLTRCNLFKREGPDYLRLPSGRLLDPLSANLPGAR